MTWVAAVACALTLFSRSDTTHRCDRQTPRHGTIPRYANASRAKMTNTNINRFSISDRLVELLDETLQPGTLTTVYLFRRNYCNIITHKLVTYYHSVNDITIYAA